LEGIGRWRAQYILRIVEVRVGSKTVLTASKHDFRSTPNNGHHQTGPVGPFGASFGQSSSDN
jgi:hypothetical protein